MINQKTINTKGLAIIQHFESLHDGDLSEIGLQPKMCPAGIWTIGWGHALKDIDGSWLKGVEGFRRLTEIYPEYLTITEKEALYLLYEDTEIYSDKVSSLNLNLNQEQFDALVSFSFNVGFTALKNSTLLKLIKKQQFSNDNLIRDEFLKWKYAEGKELKGLYRRRKSEANLFLTGNLNFYD